MQVLEDDDEQVSEASKDVPRSRHRSIGRTTAAIQWIQVVSAVGTMIATALLVAATVFLARLTEQLADAAKSQSEYLRQQTEVLRVSEERERDRWVTKVQLDPITYVYENEPRAFYAFSIANAGVSDVTVQSAGFVIPWAPGKPILNTVDAVPVYERDGSRLEHTARLPKLLRPSESFRVVYEGEGLKAKLGGQPARPYCVDSLGQLHFGPWQRFSI